MKSQKILDELAQRLSFIWSRAQRSGTINFTIVQGGETYTCQELHPPTVASLLTFLSQRGLIRSCGEVSGDTREGRRIRASVEASCDQPCVALQLQPLPADE